MSQVLVDRDALAQMLAECYQLMVAYAVEGGALRPSQGEQLTLEAGSPLVILAVEAGLPIPGPMEPGHVPPAPPQHPFDVGKVFRLIAQCEDRMGGRLDQGEATAGTYRADGDPRLRCIDDGKVVYGTQAKAEGAARTMSERAKAMHAYLGPCGHYHVARDKFRLPADTQLLTQAGQDIKEP